MDFVIGIVLYGPDWDSLWPRLQSIHERPIHIFDNSAGPASAQVLEKINVRPHTIYKHMGSNCGICQPYQELVKSDVEFDYLITLDQDSLADGEFVESLVQEFLEYHESHSPSLNSSIETTTSNTAAVFAPFHQVFEHQTPPAERFRSVKAIMSSGSIISRQAILSVGGFDERYWLDGFDHDYCLALRHHGYQIIMANQIILKHPLGEAIEKKLFWQSESREFTQHPIWRMRLIARNRRLLWYKHIYDIKWILREHWQELKDIFRVILVEDSKISRLKAIVLGIVDYYTGRRGAPHFLKDAEDRL